MGDYKIGYGRPPKGRPFKPGESGNRKGRPERTPNELGEIVQKALDAPMQYTENGKPKTGTRREVAIRLLIENSKKGDVGAAELLLKKRKHALRNGQKSALQLIVTDWLPDYPSPTDDQKAQPPGPPAAEPINDPGDSKQGGRDQHHIVEDKPTQEEGG